MKEHLHGLFVIIWFGLVGCDSEKKVAEHQASADQFIAEQNYDAAIIELKNVLQQAPEQVQSRLLLGDLYYQQGAYLAAEKEYQRALESGAEHNVIVPKLGLTYLKSDKVEPIDALYRQYPRLSAQAASTLIAAFALASINRGELQRSAELLVIAEQKQADNLYAQLATASLTARSAPLAKQVEQRQIALAMVAEILLKTPDNIEANLLQGHLLLAANDAKKAQRAFEKVIELAPSAPQYVLYLIQSLMQQQDYQQAEPHINLLLDVAPSHPTLNDYKAQVLYARDDFRQAQQHAELAIQNGSRHGVTFVIAGLSAMQQKHYEQAYRQLYQVQHQIAKDHPIARLFAYLQLELGLLGQASETLNNLTELQPSDAVLFASATSELTKLGLDKAALSYAKKAASLDKSGVNTVKLGVLKLANHDMTGLEELGDALLKAPDLIEARLAWVYSELSQGKLEQATQAANVLLDDFPNDLRGYTLKGLIEKRAQRPEQALQLFDQALAKSAYDPVTLLAKVATLAESGREPEAYQLAVLNLQHNSHKSYVVHRFMDYAQRYDHVADAQQRVQSLYQASPDNASLRWAYALGLALSSQREQAISLLAEQEREQLTPGEFLLLGDLYANNKQAEKAEQIYRHWLQLSPSNSLIYQRLIAINERQHDYSSALRYAQKAVQRFPELKFFTLQEANMRYEQGQVRTARVILDGLAEPLQQHPLTLRLRARIALHFKDYDKGLMLWQRYYELQPSSEALVALSHLYELRGEPQQAIAILQQDLARYRGASPVHLKLAELLLPMQPEQSMVHYITVIESDPDNLLALNNLAWLYLERGDYQQALPHAKRAYQLSAQSASIVDTYGVILLRLGEQALAFEVLQEAYQLEHNNNAIALHYAEALIGQNRKVQAKQMLVAIAPKKSKLVALKARLLHDL